MNLQRILTEIDNLSPAEQLLVKEKIETNMAEKKFFEERNACIKTETDSPSYHQSKITEFEELVKEAGGSVGKRGTPKNQNGTITTCTCFKVPKGTGKLLHQVD